MIFKSLFGSGFYVFQAKIKSDIPLGGCGWKHWPQIWLQGNGVYFHLHCANVLDFGVLNNFPLSNERIPKWVISGVSTIKLSTSPLNGHLTNK